MAQHSRCYLRGVNFQLPFPTEENNFPLLQQVVSSVIKLLASVTQSEAICFVPSRRATATLRKSSENLCKMHMKGEEISKIEEKHFVL
jgi:hypothetical protein